ncbi:MAG: glycosyltransferase family 39 protein [Vicinamibacterales bacterium]
MIDRAPDVDAPGSGPAVRTPRSPVWLGVGAAAAALAAAAFAVPGEALAGGLPLPPGLRANAWLMTDLQTTRLVAVAAAAATALAAGVLWWRPAAVDRVPMAVDRLLGQVAGPSAVTAWMLATIVAAKTALQFGLYFLGYRAYGADDFSRALTADYWRQFHRLDFGWEGWLGLSGSGWLPFPDYLFGLALALHRDLYVTPRLVNLALSAGVVLLAYAIGRELFGKVAGVVTAVLAAFQPWHVWLGLSSMTSDLSAVVVLQLFALACIRWLRHDTPGRLLAAAAWLAVANGFRYENWFFCGVFGVFVLHAAYRRRQAGQLAPRWLASACAAAALMAAYPLFWMAGSYVVLGDWLPSLHSVNAWMVTGMADREAVRAGATRLAVSQSPVYPQMNMLVMAAGAFPLEIALVTAGIVLAVRRGVERAAWRYLGAVAATFAVCLVVFKGQLPASIFYARFLVLFVVLALPWAGYAVVWTLTRPGPWRTEVTAAVGLVLGVTLLFDAGRSLNYPSVYPREAIDVGESLRELQAAGRVAPDARILIERNQDWGDLGIVVLAGRPERFTAVNELVYRRQALLSLPVNRALADDPPPSEWRSDVRGTACDEGFAAPTCRASLLAGRYDLVILSSPERVRSFEAAFQAPSWRRGHYVVFDAGGLR